MSLLKSVRTGRMSRRDILKHSGIFTASAALAPVAAAAQAGGVVEPQSVSTLTANGTPTANLYTEIGVRPIVNARGTFTIITGSQSLPEVKQAMFEASRYYVHLDELMPAVGSEIAKLMGAPAAIVTCGCEAAIALATVACMCGTDPEESQAFPYIREKNQVIIPRYSRNPYDFGVRMSGPEIVEVETDDELRAKLNSKTAMIYLYAGPRGFQEPLSIKTVCAIAKEKGVPVFVDAAAEEPRVPNIHLAAGATFVGYSGGKCMRGPQTAGVLLGPKDLVAAAFWNAAPHHNWGRALKVGKEEAMGMLAAVRMWYKRDHDAEQKQWLQWIQYIGDAVKGIPTVTAEVRMPGEDLSNRAPTLRLHWDATKVGITGTELVEMLDKGTPRILVDGGTGTRPDQMQSTLGIMPYMLQPGDYKVVAATIARYMRKPGEVPKKPVFGDAQVKLDGTWNVEITYSLGVGHQVLTLQQQGGAITGEQKGEIYSAQMSGKVEGDHAFLNSTMKANGQEIRFNFSGVVDGSKYSGDLNLGEYGRATFVATRA